MGVPTVMVTFWEKCPFPPPVEIREHPEFHDLMEMDKSSWPPCLLWHGWLLLSEVNGAPLKLGVLGKVLIFWSVLLGGTLLMRLRSGNYRLVLMLCLLPGG